MAGHIVITGAAGFIGSCLAAFFNRQGHYNLILVDDFTRRDKLGNHQHLIYKEKIQRDAFPHCLERQKFELSAIIHLGARTDTAEQDVALFERLNVNYSKAMWQAATERQIPLIYASSAATYGMGEHGYSDNHAVVPKLQPLNPYGQSKQKFDLWALDQGAAPPFWAGIKFFNVYGPNEYHKGRMASVVYHAFQQIQSTGKVKLFRSHNPSYKDGYQLRDFIYVLDVVRNLYWMLENQPESGLYNLGTGKAEPFLQLAQSVFSALQMEERIEFIDTPEDIRDTYQYFTEAEMTKMRKAGYDHPFCGLDVCAKEYVDQYLVHNSYYSVPVT